MIKVLFIITGGLHSDGITLSQLEVLKHINKSKFKVDILEVNDSDADIAIKFKEYGCKLIKMPNRKRELIKYRRMLKNIIKNNNYDVIHVHGSSSLLWIELSIAKKYNIPIRIAHSRNTMCDHKLLDKLLRKRFHKTYNKALACGKEAGEWLFNNDNFIILHNGKDFDKFKFDSTIRKEYREKLNIKNEIAYGHVGSFNAQKNHEFLVNSFYEFHKENRKSKLFLFGTGPNLDKIKKLVHELNVDDSVIFCGVVSDIENYLQAMDIMLFPSKFEGLPNVVLEWQAVGLPCIISKNITNECIISNQVYKCSIENIEEWVNHMNKIKPLDDESRIDEANKNKERLIDEGFEILSNVKKLEDIYMGIGDISEKKYI